jgi:surface antigen
MVERSAAMRRLSVFAFLAGLAWISAPSIAAAQSTGCSSTSNVGRLFGSLAGAVGRKVAGTDFGNNLSSTIACALSKAEQKQAANTQTEALNSGKTGSASRKTWASDERKGVGGGTEVVSRSSGGDGQCAVQRTFITDVDGNEKSIERQMCRQPDGRWVANA